jgi:signal transduction histidine kinase
MTQKRSLLSAWLPRATSARAARDSQAGPTPTVTRVPLLLRPTQPQRVLGLAVGVSLVAAESLFVLLLDERSRGDVFGVVFVLGVLVVATGWGFGLGATTALASAVAYEHFHRLEGGGTRVATWGQDWTGVAVFLVVALSAAALAELARSRAAEAHLRRRQVQDSRDDLAVLAEQQAALRRVATLVARGAPPTEVFSAVALELARVLGVRNASVWRYQTDGAATLLAAWDEPGATKMPVGRRFSLEGDNIAAMVLHTGRPARMDSHDTAAGPAAAAIRELGLQGGAGAPIIVGGRRWGVAVAGWSRVEPMPPDTEGRVGDFADLVAMAIANAQTHADLTDSRVRIVAAADDARRRIERDLHDGAQQRLVSLGLGLRNAEANVPAELGLLRQQISRLATSATEVSKDLQELSRGIHPAILSNGGLGPAIKTLARRSVVPVELDIAVKGRLPERTEVAAYYVVAEALTNAAKYAGASAVTVSVHTEGDSLHLSIADDGIGGADTAKGSGLIGLVDRVEAIGGRMTISSHPGEGTSLWVAIPFSVQVRE